MPLTPEKIEKCCKGKLKYGNRQSAIAGMKRLYALVPKAGVMSPYKCPNCDWWHFGHHPALTSRSKNLSPRQSF